MRIKSIAFLAALLLIGAFSNAAPPFMHMETGISLPDTIAGFNRGEAKPYQGSADEGVAIPYRNDEIEATIFIRKINPKEFGSPQAIINDSLAVVKGMEQSGVYSNVKIYGSADDAATPGWSKGAFTATFQARFLMSFIYATILKDYGIKLRISTPDPRKDGVQKFVSEFQRIVNEFR